MLTGVPAWLLWRSYYLGRLPGLGRKKRVALIGPWELPSVRRLRVFRWSNGANCHLRKAMRLHDKVAIVTGGDTGIGKAISTVMAQEGRSRRYRLPRECSAGFRVGRSNRELRRPCMGRRLRYFQGGRRRRLVAGAVKHFGKIDILVNNAGVEEQRPFLEMPFEAWRKVIDIDLTGPWLCSQRAAKQMVRQKRGGRIIINCILQAKPWLSMFVTARQLSRSPRRVIELCS